MADDQTPEGPASPGQPPAAASAEPAPDQPGSAPDAPRLGPIIAAPPFRFTPPVQPVSPPVVQVGPAASPVFIDIGDKASQAAITRDGVQIPVIPIDPSQLQNVHLIPPLFTERVVSQSIPPGTRVPQGTSVDLVLASPTVLPISIVPGIHPVFLGPTGQTPNTLAGVYTQFIQNNAALQGVLSRSTTAPSDPNSPDFTTIVSAFAGLSPPVQATPADVAAAFTGLQAAMTFGS